MIERTFDLVNSDGVAYTLTYVDSYTGFLYNVSGLGAEHKATYQKIGNEYELIKDEMNQGKISGVIFFMSAYPYQEYLRFADFCQDKKLKLHYRTPAGEFFRDGKITKLEKNENGGAMKIKFASGRFSRICIAPCTSISRMTFCPWFRCSSMGAMGVP